MKLHKNSLKLAGLYLAILMIISLFFSANVYQLSTQEFERGLRRPGPGSPINRLPPEGEGRFTRDALLREREEQFQAAKSRILQRLVLTNILILLGGGALSYYLALRTLRPIEEAHDAQSRFTADASHELRTPIAAMLTETEVALMDPKLTLAKAKQLLSSNIEELNKLTELSAGLLRLAQVEGHAIDMVDLEISEVVQKAVSRLMPMAKKKSILINTQPTHKVIIKGDESSLVEVLVIILDNAIKYSPSNSDITVSVESTAKAAVVNITDKGPGIKATELPHIFERFYRADSSRNKQKVSGYGLGLAIAKNIIDIHGGKIIAQSKPSEGTKFTISLPRVG